jgi:protein-tyrosine phosphatase
LRTFYRAAIPVARAVQNPALLPRLFDGSGSSFLRTQPSLKDAIRGTCTAITKEVISERLLDLHLAATTEGWNEAADPLMTSRPPAYRKDRASTELLAAAGVCQAQFNFLNAYTIIGVTDRLDQPEGPSSVFPLKPTGSEFEVPAPLEDGFQIFVGSQRDGVRYPQLAANGISAIINMVDYGKFSALGYSVNLEVPDFRMLRYAAMDNNQQNLMIYYLDTSALTEEMRVQGRKILIHCVGGHSRSVSMYLAWFICHTPNGENGYRAEMRRVQAVRVSGISGEGLKFQLAHLAHWKSMNGTCAGYTPFSHLGMGLHWNGASYTEIDDPALVAAVRSFM